MESEETKKERHTPLNPPSMGKEVEQFLSIRTCRFRGGEGTFISLVVILRKGKRKFYKR